jgi:hypothetical protein
MKRGLPEGQDPGCIPIQLIGRRRCSGVKRRSTLVVKLHPISFFLLFDQARTSSSHAHWVGLQEGREAKYMCHLWWIEWQTPRYCREQGFKTNIPHLCVTCFALRTSPMRTPFWRESVNYGARSLLLLESKIHIGGTIAQHETMESRRPIPAVLAFICQPA